MAKFHISKAAETRKWIHEDDLKIICEAWERFYGDVGVFESAAGALLMGRFLGYNGLRVLHTWPTLRKYEQILGISFKDTLEPYTADSERLNGIRYAKKFGAFWKAVAAGVSSEPGARVCPKGS
jgi:hypothetical protein